MKKLFITLFLIVAVYGIFYFAKKLNVDASDSYPTSTQSSYSNLLDVKLPAKLPSQIKNYTQYTTSFNKKNKTPNYVAWELLGTETDGSESRHNKFWQDNDIDGCPTTNDYRNSGYDRGHMCPAADNKYSSQSMEESFSLANICPQNHALNSGAWSTLESKCRLWAQRDSVLMIVAGPIYESSDTETIGANKVRVPSSFFKVIIAPYAAQPRGIGFIYPNMKSPGNMQNYALTIDQVEEITGYDFFYSLPDDIENDIESKFSFKEWNRTK